MKKLFGTKPRPKTSPTAPREANGLVLEDPSFRTPIHAAFASQNQQSSLHPHNTAIRKSSHDDERWEMITPFIDPSFNQQPSNAASRGPSTPLGGSTPVSTPLSARSPSPLHGQTITPFPTTKTHSSRDREREREIPNTIKKKLPSNATGGAVSILRALEPPRIEAVANPPRIPRTQSEEQFSTTQVASRDRDRDKEVQHNKKPFWTSGKERERDKEREKPNDRDRDVPSHWDRTREREREKERGRPDEDGQAELTRMIGYLTATASEDWAMVLDVSERASANENNAKEAVRALRREFRYGEPSAQLSAARLWAIMLRNSTEHFITQSTSRKFLDTIEELLSSSRTSPVVRERLLDVVAAAAYASGAKNSKTDREGFRGLWRRVKPLDKPDEGVPFDLDDAMFNPPVLNSRGVQIENPLVHEPPSIAKDLVPPAPTSNRKRHKSPTRNRIIPPDEDMRRLFQECKIGQGNASLLSQAVSLSKPEDIRKQAVTKEFYVKCRASQELIFAQIPWASAGAERSRVDKDKELQQRKRTQSTNSFQGDEGPVEVTQEEELLAALLAANAELIEALQQYDDMMRIAKERKVEHRSRKESKNQQKVEQEQLSVPFTTRAESSSSRSPSPSRDSHSPAPSIHIQALSHYSEQLHPHVSSSDVNGQNLAPPPAAPHGPRSPAFPLHHSRTPSPATPGMDFELGPSPGSINGFDLDHKVKAAPSVRDAYWDGESDLSSTPQRPSAKALGKRRAPETPRAESFGSEDLLSQREKDAFSSEGDLDSDSDDSGNGVQRRQTLYVYDAAAERTQQRIQEGSASLLVGIH